MELQEDIDVIADRIADGLDRPACMAQIGSRDLASSGSKRIELKGLVPAVYNPASLVGEFLEVICAAVPSVGVRLDAVSYLSPHQVVYRLLACLADNVPQGHLNSGHGGIHDGAGIVLNLVELEPKILNVERVGSD